MALTGGKEQASKPSKELLAGFVMGVSQTGHFCHYRLLQDVSSELYIWSPLLQPVGNIKDGVNKEKNEHRD